MLKSRRQVLHRRIAEILRDNLAAAASAEPALLAHHFTQAGLTEAAFEWWAKAGQQSLERSALVEAVDQFARALGQIAALPATPALRREQIKASGRAHNRARPRQRVYRAGNQGGYGASTSADRTSRGARRAS